MDTLNSHNAFADTSRIEDETGSPVIAYEEPTSQAEDERRPQEAQEAFMKLAHAM